MKVNRFSEICIQISDAAPVSSMATHLLVRTWNSAQSCRRDQPVANSVSPLIGGKHDTCNAVLWRRDDRGMSAFVACAVSVAVRRGGNANLRAGKHRCAVEGHSRHV